MLGLMIAAIIVACRTVFGDAEMGPVVYDATEFLFIWHIVCLSIIAALFLFVLMAVFFTGGGAGKLLALVGTPIIAIVLGLTGALFIGGVLCVQKASEYGTITDINEWSVGPVVIGCVLYGLGCLGQLLNRGSGSSD